MRKKGKFRCDDKDGTGSYICVCGSGDGWALLAAKTGKEFRILAAEIDELIGNKYTPDRTTTNPARTSLAQRRERSVVNLQSSLRYVVPVLKAI